MRARLEQWTDLDAWRRLGARVPPDLKRALPYGIVLALALGFSVVLGAHLSNAQPSESRPFGWDGPAAFEFAIAMVRKDLVLATTIPALMLGARALDRRDPSRDGALSVAGVFGMHAATLSVAVVAAGGIGAWGTFKTPWDAYAAFVAAHMLLALAFYAVAFVWSATLRRHALAASFATWVVFVLLYDNFVQLLVLREMGYPGIQARAFPEWFYVAQGLSPLTSYRAVLILWRPRFRDYVEQLALDGADLPAWMVPATFSALLVVMWVALPLLLALAVWRLRARFTPADHASSTNAPTDG